MARLILNEVVPSMVWSVDAKEGIVLSVWAHTRPECGTAFAITKTAVIRPTATSKDSGHLFY